MLVETAIDILKEAELKQLEIKNDKPAVLGYINSAILEIYKRFNLWEEEAVITIVDGTVNYVLDGVDANVAMDLSDHNYLFVEQVWLEPDATVEEEVEDCLLTLNDRRDPNGVDTPKYNRVKIHVHPDSVLLDARTLKVVYRAAPIALLSEKAAIPLPPQFDECLYSYVGYRGHGSVTGDEKTENNTHYKRFVASCNQVVFQGLYIQDDLASNKFEQRGFV